MSLPPGTRLGTCEGLTLRISGFGGIYLTPDGRTAAIGHIRKLSELYLVEGVQ